MDKSVKFLKNALRGNKVGAVSRSSKFVIKEVLKNIKGDVKNIVEYGPGDGVLTVELLKRLPADGHLYAVELDPNFVIELSKIKDKRLSVIEGKIEDVSLNPLKYGIKKSELVVSSIPFSFIKKDDREIIVKNIEKTLHVGGQFIIFHQYSLLMLKIMKKFFINVESFFEPRNFLPCFIIVGKK